MTSTADTRESIISERLGEESTEMAFALLVMRMVVFVQREMMMELLIEAEISTMSVGLSKFSTIHLLPSSSFRAGFLLRILSGLGFLPGRGDLLDVCEDDREGAEGTAAEARREGFLWVCEGSTFLRLEVTEEPCEIWSNMALMPSEGFLETPLVGMGGGGGGPSKEGRGGGGGGPGVEEGEETDLEAVCPALTSLRASMASMPSLFQVTPEE